MPTRSTRSAWSGSWVRGDEAGRERGGPEAVAGPGEAVAHVGGVDARVEPDDQHAHAGTDGVGEHARARRLDVDPLLAVVDEARRS